MHKYHLIVQRMNLYCLKDDIERAILTEKKLDPIDRFADDK